MRNLLYTLVIGLPLCICSPTTLANEIYGIWDGGEHGLLILSENKTVSFGDTSGTYELTPPNQITIHSPQGGELSQYDIQGDTLRIINPETQAVELELTRMQVLPVDTAMLAGEWFSTYEGENSTNYSYAKRNADGAYYYKSIDLYSETKEYDVFELKGQWKIKENTRIIEYSDTLPDEPIYEYYLVEQDGDKLTFIDHQGYHYTEAPGTKDALPDIPKGYTAKPPKVVAPGLLGDNQVDDAPLIETKAAEHDIKLTEGELIGEWIGISVDGAIESYTYNNRKADGTYHLINVDIDHEHKAFNRFETKGNWELINGDVISETDETDPSALPYRYKILTVEDGQYAYKSIDGHRFSERKGSLDEFPDIPTHYKDIRAANQPRPSPLLPLPAQ